MLIVDCFNYVCINLYVFSSVNIIKLYAEKTGNSYWGKFRLSCLFKMVAAMSNRCIKPGLDVSTKKPYDFSVYTGLHGQFKLYN